MMKFVRIEMSERDKMMMIDWRRYVERRNEEDDDDFGLGNRQSQGFRLGNQESRGFRLGNQESRFDRKDEFEIEKKRKVKRVGF